MAEPLTAEQLDAIRQDSAMVHLFAHDQIVATIDAQAVEIDRLKKWAILPGYRAVDILELEALMDERDALQAEVARLKAMPGAVPDGWVLVPVEPDDKMLSRARRWNIGASWATDIYRGMLSAAPQPPSTYTHGDVVALVEAVDPVLRDLSDALERLDDLGVNTPSDADTHAVTLLLTLKPFTATGQGGER